MAAVNAGALQYDFKADISDIKAKVAEIRQQMQQVGTQAKQAGDDITSGMRAARGQVEEMGLATRVTANLLAGLAKGFVAGLLVQGISASISAVAELGQTAKLTYTSLQDLQRLQIAAQGQGIGSKEFNDGAQKFAKLLNDAARDTNSLSELFKANGVSLTDQTGKAKSFKDMLLAAADMVKNARTEFDKIEIAQRVGLTKEWVDFLEQGKDAIAAQADEAERTGTILDDATVKKAEEFRRAWEAAVASWQDFFQKAIVYITELISGLWDKVKAVADLMQAVSLNAKLTTGAPLNKDDVAYAQKRIKDGSATETQRLRDAIEAQRLSESLDPNEEGNVAVVRRRASTATAGPRKTGTIIPGKGGDSGGADRMDGIERYLSQMQRAVELAKVEYETFGKGTAERLKAVNLVRAEEVARREGRDLTEDERKKIGQMSEEQARFNDLLERARDIQQAVKSLGDTFANAIDDWIVRGTKFKDVLANLARSLASMALKGTLTGEGPIGSLLGLGGKNGGMGGIFGAIFNGLFGGGKAVGGPVSPSKGYVVGENGPEWFQPNSAGSIIPNGAMQQTGPTGPKITIQQTFTADANPRELAQMASTIEQRTLGAVKMAIARGSM